MSWRQQLPDWVALGDESDIEWWLLAAWWFALALMFSAIIFGIIMTIISI